MTAREESAGIFGPDPFRVAAVRDQGAGELFDVVVVDDFAEQIPLAAFALNGFRITSPRAGS